MEGSPGTDGRTVRRTRGRPAELFKLALRGGRNRGIPGCRPNLVVLFYPVIVVETPGLEPTLSGACHHRLARVDRWQLDRTRKPTVALHLTSLPRSTMSVTDRPKPVQRYGESAHSRAGRLWAGLRHRGLRHVRRYEVPIVVVHRAMRHMDQSSAPYLPGNSEGEHRRETGCPSSGPPPSACSRPTAEAVEGQRVNTGLRKAGLGMGAYRSQHPVTARIRT